MATNMDNKGLRSLSLVCLLLIALTVSAADVSSQQQANVQEYKFKFNKKLRELRRMLGESQDRVVRMNIERFQEYHVERPRPYVLVVYFYRNVPEHMEMLDTFRAVAKQWGRIKPEYGRKNQRRRPIFFVAVKYQQDKSYYQLFEQLDFKPNKAILVSDGTEIFLEGRRLAQYLEKRWWNIRDGLFPTRRVMSFLGDCLPPHLQYEDDPWDLFDALWKLCLITGLLAFAYIKLFPYVTHPSVWIVGFFVIYYYSAGCFVWCKKRNANWTGIKDDQTEYVFPSLSMQHIAEGHLIATMVLSVCVASLLVFYANHKINHWLARRAVTAVLFYVIYYLLFHIEDFLKKKMVYEPQWEPKSWAFKGPSIRNDQGHTL